MSDALRGTVLLVSVLLWLPFLRPVLDGDMAVEQGLLRYGMTLLLAWGGCAGLAALVNGYAAASAADEEPVGAGGAGAGEDRRGAGRGSGGSSADPSELLLRRADDVTISESGGS